MSVVALCLQMYSRAAIGIKKTTDILWSPDVEGRIREARDHAVEVRRELEIEMERVRRETVGAEQQEDRGDALVSRLALEAQIQAELLVQTKRAKERTAQETARAELAESRLRETKVCQFPSQPDCLLQSVRSGHWANTPIHWQLA